MLQNITQNTANDSIEGHKRHLVVVGKVGTHKDRHLFPKKNSDNIQNAQYFSRVGREQTANEKGMVASKPQIPAWQAIEPAQCCPFKFAKPCQGVEGFGKQLSKRQFRSIIAIVRMKRGWCYQRCMIQFFLLFSLPLDKNHLVSQLRHLVSFRRKMLSSDASIRNKPRCNEHGY